LPQVSYGGWITTYAIRQLEMPVDAAALLNALYWGSFTAGAARRACWDVAPCTAELDVAHWQGAC
jgi:hypothetical protein